MFGMMHVFSVLPPGGCFLAVVNPPPWGSFSEVLS
jgi:hypothetical protein